MESVVSSSEPRFSAFSLDSDKNGLLKLPQDTSKLKIVDPSVKASGYFSGLGYHTPVMTPLFLRPPTGRTSTSRTWGTVGSWPPSAPS